MEQMLVHFTTIFTLFIVKIYQVLICDPKKIVYQVFYIQKGSGGAANKFSGFELS